MAVVAGWRIGRANGTSRMRRRMLGAVFLSPRSRFGVDTHHNCKLLTRRRSLFPALCGRRQVKGVDRVKNSQCSLFCPQLGVKVDIPANGVDQIAGLLGPQGLPLERTFGDVVSHESYARYEPRRIRLPSEFVALARCVHVVQGSCVLPEGRARRGRDTTAARHL